jgi:hypothetical protein
MAIIGLRNRYRLRCGKRVAARRHLPRDCSGGGSAAQTFGPASAASPFGNDTQASPEPLTFHTPPKLRAVTQPCRPLHVEPGKIALKRALAGSEHVRTLTAQNPAHEAPARNHVPRGTMDETSSSLPT